MVRTTNFDELYPLTLGVGGSVLEVANSSNSGYYPDVVGELGDLTVVQLYGITSLSSNMGDNTVGSVLTTVQTSPWVAQFAVPSNSAAPSIGSNVSITAVFDGAGTALAVGSNTVDLEIPFAATLIRATLLLDQASNTVLDVWSDAYGNYPPTIADAITGASPPTTSSAAKSQDTTLSGWTTSLAAGNTLRISIASNSAATRATLSLVAARGLP